MILVALRHYENGMGVIHIGIVWCAEICFFQLNELIKQVRCLAVTNK